MAKRSQAFRNGDARRRAAERSAATGDLDAQARAVVELIRAGEFDPIRAEVAAALGHPVAKLVDETVKPLDLSYDHKLIAAARLAGPHNGMTWAADVLERYKNLTPARGAAGSPNPRRLVEAAVSVARRLSEPGERVGALDSVHMDEVNQLERDSLTAMDSSPNFSPLRAFMDGVHSLLVGARYGFARPDINTDWVALHVVAAVNHVAAAVYRAAEPLPRRGPGKETPARQAARLKMKVVACLRLADCLMDPANGLDVSDGGAEWIKKREEEKAEEARFDKLFEEILAEARKRPASDAGA